MAYAISYPCTFCYDEVDNDAEAVECDLCKQWTHIACNTGITTRKYRACLKWKKDIPFKCITCSVQVELEEMGELLYYIFGVCGIGVSFNFFKKKC